jgi:hypothetical protein
MYIFTDFWTFSGRKSQIIGSVNRKIRKVSHLRKVRKTEKLIKVFKFAKLRFARTNLRPHTCAICRKFRPFFEKQSYIQNIH